MKHLIAAIAMLGPCLAVAAPNTNYLTCAGISYVHTITVAKNAAGLESAFYVLKTYSGKILKGFEVARDWHSPTTFYSVKNQDGFELKITETPVKSPKYAPLLETSGVAVTFHGRSIEEVKFCLVDPSVTWAERE